MADVVAIGDVNVDFLMSVDRYPAPGDCAISQASTWQVGGSASNAAIVLSQLGVDTAMMGRIGLDPLSAWVTDEMETAGIDMAPARQDPESMTGFCVIPVSPDGERTMFTERGANARLSADDVDEALVAPARWLHASGYMLFTRSGRAAFAEAIDQARRADVRVSVDVGIGATLAAHREALDERLPHIDVLLANEAELAILTGQSDLSRAAHAVRDRGTRMVMIKRGAEGCRAVTDGDDWALPSLAIAPVDATGAGDAFSAGVIAARLADLDLRSSVMLANALGGLSATRQGAGRALPDRAQAAHFIRELSHSDDRPEWRDELTALARWLTDGI